MDDGKVSPLKAHLSCKTVTFADASFCPGCGKKLTKDNTMPVNMDNPEVTPDWVEDILQGKCCGWYTDISVIS